MRAFSTPGRRPQTGKREREHRGRSGSGSVLGRPGIGEIGNVPGELDAGEYRVRQLPQARSRRDIWRQQQAPSVYIADVI